MKLSDLSNILLARIKLIYGKTTPLRIAHFITTRCNLNCSFCGCKDMMYDEMNTDEIKVAMKTFKGLGTFAWGFTGGEPFIRKDLVELLRYAKSLNLYTSVVTNGTIFKEIEKLSPGIIDFVMVSFHGRDERTKAIKGDKYADNVLQTIDYLTANKFNVCLSSTFDDNSREDIRYTIEYAKARGISCSFEPVFDFSTQTEDKKYLEDPKALQRLVANIDYLIERKKQGDPVWNSLPYLEWVRYYGNAKPFYCYAGKLYATMMPDGSLRRCPKYGNKLRYGDYREDFDKLNAEPHMCYCYPWCHIEYSLNFSFRVGTIINTLKKL